MVTKKNTWIDSILLFIVNMLSYGYLSFIRICTWSQTEFGGNSEGNSHFQQVSDAIYWPLRPAPVCCSLEFCRDRECIVYPSKSNCFHEITSFFFNLQSGFSWVYQLKWNKDSKLHTVHTGWCILIVQVSFKSHSQRSSYFCNLQ